MLADAAPAAPGESGGAPELMREALRGVEGYDALEAAEWEARRAAVERQNEEARRLKRERRAAAEVAQRTQVSFRVLPLHVQSPLQSLQGNEPVFPL